MRVLVTGAGGSLGSHLVKAMSEGNDFKVRAMVRSGSDISKLKGFEESICYCDLLDKNSIDEAIKDVDIIYHLAAATSGSHFEMMMNTVIATENLLDSMKGKKISRFVLVSSFSVYKLTSLKVGSFLDENCPIEDNLKERDPYTITKVRQEMVAKIKCSEMGIPLTIIRPGKIYGPYDNPIPPQLGLQIPGICFLLIGGNAEIPFTHVSNCADAIYLAGVSPGSEYEVFNIVDDNLPTQRQYIKLYKSVLGKIPRKISIPYSVFYKMCIGFEKASKKTKGNIPPVITRYRAENLWKKLFYNNHKVKKSLSWIPQISTQKGLSEMLYSQPRS